MKIFESIFNKNDNNSEFEKAFSDLKKMGEIVPSAKKTYELLKDLNKQSLEKIEEYLKTKKGLKDEHREKLLEAKNKWQSSWTDFMDVLMYLERLEL